MSRAVITESHLTDIGDAIRAKLGVSTTYKPGQMAAAIESIPDQPTLVSKNITANGTYDPADDNADGYSGVTVNIPQGGINLLTSTQWDALTTEQKQAYGLVAIQYANTGYERGMLVNGADYVDVGSYLPYSNEGKIICVAEPNNYDASSTEWGYGTNPIQLSASESIQNADGSVAIKTKTSGTLAYVDLGVASSPFTAYIVAKLGSASSGSYTRELGVMDQRSSGAGMMLFGNNNVNVSSWASDTATGKNPTSYFVGVLQFASSGSAFGSVISSKNDTPSFITKSPRMAGRYITIGRTDIDSSTSNAEPSDMDVLFLGVVSEGESQSVVAQNMVYLASQYIP